MIGVNVRDCRKAAGLTQEALAEKADLHKRLRKMNPKVRLEIHFKAAVQNLKTAG